MTDKKTLKALPTFVLTDVDGRSGEFPCHFWNEDGFPKPRVLPLCELECTLCRARPQDIKSDPYDFFGWSLKEHIKDLNIWINVYVDFFFII